MTFTTLISIALGIGLAASTGFRVFLPLFALALLLVFAIAAAITILGVATLAEAVGYLVPYFDHLLDTLAVPLAGLAGTAVVASTAADLSPAVTWALAIIAGGGAAAAIKGTAATTRVASTAASGGLANPVVSTAETGMAVVMTALSLFVPVLAVLLVIGLVVWLARRYTARRSTI